MSGPFYIISTQGIFPCHQATVSIWARHALTTELFNWGRLVLERWMQARSPQAREYCA